MTNEQLAILLDSLAMQARLLADWVNSLIADGQREYVKTWVGEGEEPKPPFDPFGFTAHLTEITEEEKRLPYFQAKNWAMKATGEFSATKAVKDFADWLQDKADELSTSE